MARAALTAVPLFAFWLILTGSLAPFDVVLGLVLSMALGGWSSSFLWGGRELGLSPKRLLGYAAYVIHLLRSVIVAAVHVAEVVLDPRMPIRPIIITHRVRFSTEAQRIAFANSVTLTPGTLTVDVDGDSFTIHCLAERFADDITSGELERRITRVFEE
jgi:multicomponent Na+:H+ antiporter subunit E